MKSRSSRKIPIDYSIKDYYNFYKKKYNSNILQGKYSKIISEFNKELINLIIEENLEYKMPYLGFTFSIRKDKRVPTIKNGRLYNTNPVDWPTTKKLWEEDEEAKDRKLLVRYLNNHSSGYVYRVFCKKFTSKMKNKSLYKFKTNRFFQRSLSKRIKDENKDKFDCYLLYNKKK